jgi:hypothetical protein
VPRDRRGRVKVREAVVSAAANAEGVTQLSWPASLNTQDRRWVLDAARRNWDTVEQRFGDQARSIAMDLTASGIVALRAELTPDIQLGPLRRWDLTPAALHDRGKTRAAHRAQQDQDAQHMAYAATAVMVIDPGLADALRTARPGTKTALLLAAAAIDLASGIRHDGPRAFLQAHFADTKAVADPGADLQRAGVSTSSLAALGLTRSPYIGLAGPVELRFDRVRWELQGLPGPTQIRLDASAMPEVSLSSPTSLVVVENLQAAEALSDSRPGIAVAWVPGVPSGPALRVVAALAIGAVQCIAVPDADLGGLRIAERLLSVEARSKTVVVDVGMQPHVPSRPFGETSIRGLETYSEHRDGRLAELARAFLARGYPVEQEAPTRSAVAQLLA